MKRTVTVLLNDINKVKRFCNEVGKFESDIDLASGRYVIDAKSIMGVFSLNLSEPIEVTIDSGMSAEIEKFVEVMEEFR